MSAKREACVAGGEASVAKGTKVCSICKEECALDLFRKRRRDGERRHSECNACRSLADRARRARQKVAAVHRWARDMNQYADSIGVLAQCCRAVFDRVGGVSAFAALYVRELERTSDAGKARLVMGLFRAQMAVDGYGRR